MWAKLSQDSKYPVPKDRCLLIWVKVVKQLQECTGNKKEKQNNRDKSEPRGKNVKF